MEPFTALIYTIGTGVISGMIANPSDRHICKVINHVAGRLRRGKQPVNHDLQRAARRASVEATLFTCESCMEAFGVAPKFLQRDVTDIVHPAPEVNALNLIRQKLHEELNRVSCEDYLPPDDIGTEEMEILIQPEEITGEERLEELRNRLREGALEEIYCWSSRGRWKQRPPGRLAEMIREGWTENGVALDWFDVMCAFFTGILKNDMTLQNFFQSRHCGGHP